MKRISVYLLLVFSCATFAQELPTTLKSTEVVPGIFLIEGADGFAGGNIGLLVGGDYVAMIDDGLEPVAAKLLDYVKEHTGRPINFMINTHVHGDHAGGNAHFANDGTVIFAHDNIRKRLLADPTPAGGADGLPVVTFSAGVTFHMNDIEAHVVHLPNAHTDGDAVIHFPAVNVIHTGDIMFNKLFPFIDLDNGGSVDGYIAAQQTLLTMADADTIFIPGHGEIASKADLEQNLAVLVEGRNRVKALVEAGKTEDAVVAANPLADYEDYSWVFITTERMIRTHYRSLTQ